MTNTPNNPAAPTTSKGVKDFCSFLKMIFDEALAEQMMDLNKESHAFVGAIGKKIKEGDDGHSDPTALRAGLRADYEIFQKKLAGGFEKFQTEIKGDNAKFQKKMKGGQRKLREDVGAQMQEIKTEISSQFRDFKHTIFWVLGVVVALAILKEPIFDYSAHRSGDLNTRIENLHTQGTE